MGTPRSQHPLCREPGAYLPAGRTRPTEPTPPPRTHRGAPRPSRPLRQGPRTRVLPAVPRHHRLAGVHARRVENLPGRPAGRGEAARRPPPIIAAVQNDNRPSNTTHALTRALRREAAVRRGEPYRTESFVHQGHKLVYDTYGEGERVRRVHARSVVGRRVEPRHRRRARRAGKPRRAARSARARTQRQADARVRLSDRHLRDTGVRAARRAPCAAKRCSVACRSEPT